MSVNTALDAVTRRWLYLATGLLLLPLLLQLKPVVALVVGGVAVLSMLLSTRGKLPLLLRIGLVAALGLAVFSVYRQIGRDTGCALLAMMLALKPTETGTVRDGRSLLTYGLFAPFATYLLDQGPLSLILGALGVCAALVVLLRLADLDSGIGMERWSPASSLQAAGKLLLLALPLVMAAFWLFPRLGSPLWGLPDRAVSKPGLSEQMTPDRWMDALVDDSPAMRVRFEGAPPPPSQMYWRAMALTNFDGRTWLAAVAAPTLPVVEQAPLRWRYSVDVEPTDARLLALLDFPVAAPPGSSINSEGSLRPNNPLTSLTRWAAESAPLQRFQPELGPAERQRALALPRFNPRTQGLGAQWRREAGNDDEAIIRRAMTMINAGFAYSLDVPEPTPNWIDDFLFQGKVGYCQQFSSAFVILMRSAGIPSRVVVGYAGGYRNPVGDYWVVRNSDAHAWAEVWLQGRGWVRADPTAAVAPERIYDTIADRMPGGRGMLSGLIDTRSFWNISDNLRRGWNDFVLGFNADRQSKMFQRLGVDKASPSSLIALLTIAAMLCIAMMAWWLSRGDRIRDPLLRAWDQLGKRYAKHGVARAPHETASDWLARVRAHDADMAARLAPLVERFNALRYAATGDANAAASLRHDIRRHRP